MPQLKKSPPLKKIDPVDRLAKWLHDTTVRECFPAYTKPNEFYNLADHVKDKYRKLAAAMLREPPPGLTLKAELPEFRVVARR